MVVLVGVSVLFGVTLASLGECRVMDGVYSCVGIGITEIPGGGHIPSTTTFIDFSDNHISNVTFLDYGALDLLVTFNISNNQIDRLDADAFDTLTTLRVLNMSKNLLNGRRLEEHMFMDLRSLKELYLSQNPIEILKENLFNFMELPSIKILDLSSCSIHTIEESAIDLPSLVHLDLSWNLISLIDKSTLRMLNQLETLDLSHNRLKVFDTIPHLPELVTLNLDNNLIETVAVGENIWNYADSLQYLYMRSVSFYVCMFYS